VRHYCIVLARFHMDDAPVFGGSVEECRNYCRELQNGHLWDDLRQHAQRILGCDIGSECLCLRVLRVYPLPITEVEQFDAEVLNDEEVAE
jgi:hypothetical protein